MKEDDKDNNTTVEENNIDDDIWRKKDVKVEVRSGWIYVMRKKKDIIAN